MTPKGKAEELWITYRFALSIKNAPLGEQKDLIAKECALICVDEIIEQNNLWISQTGCGTNNYWIEVKKEINNF